MVVYFDTSAIIKKYLVEEGSENLIHFLDSTDIAYVSSLTILETFSVFSRAHHSKMITKEDFEHSKSTFLEELDSFTVIEIDKGIRETAFNQFDHQHLKTLDMIQLCCAIQCQDIVDIVAVSDLRLKKAFLNQGFSIFDPIVD